MADIKFPIMDEFAKKVAEKALDEFLYDGKSIREWMQIIASEDAISRQAALDLPRIKTHNVWGNVIKESVDVEDVRRLPPVKPQPKTGHWKNKCSKCEYHINPDYTRCHECKAESEDKDGNK